MEGEQSDLGLEETGGDPGVEAEARSLGWAPKEKWRGPEEQWVDAEAFMEKAQIVLPILREKNKGLHSSVDTLAGELRATKAALKTLQDSHEEDVKERVKAARAELAEKIKEAREDNDVELEMKLLDKRQELKEAVKEKKEVAAEETPAEHPAFIAWKARHPELVTDSEAARTALSLGAVISAEGKWQGEAFFEELDKRMERFSGKPSRNTTSKVEGSRSGGEEGTKTKGSYASLPREAKEVCDSFLSEKVGPDRKYKTDADWRASYAKSFYEMETK